MILNIWWGKSELLQCWWCSSDGSYQCVGCVVTCVEHGCDCWAHSQEHACGGQSSMSAVLFLSTRLFWDRVSDWTAGSTLGLGWPQTAPEIPLPFSTLLGLWLHTAVLGFLCGWWGFGLRSSCFQSTDFCPLSHLQAPGHSNLCISVIYAKCEVKTECGWIWWHPPLIVTLGKVGRWVSVSFRLAGQSGLHSETLCKKKLSVVKSIRARLKGYKGFLRIYLGI